MSSKPVDFLGVKVLPQSNLNWCWAAVAAAIGNFYEPNRGWTECELATHFAKCDCCTAPNVPACNQVQHIADAMTRYTHNLRGAARDQPDNCWLTADEIRAEIGAGHPICMRLVWTALPPDSPAHDIVVRGIFKDVNGVDYLNVSDPAPNVGNAAVKLSDLDGNYGLFHGKLNASYLTKSASA